MAKKTGKKILEFLLGEAITNRPIFLSDLHSDIYRFAKKNKLPANQVKRIVKKVLERNLGEAFSKDFSKKPKTLGGH